jgi:hypothetical protein
MSNTPAIATGQGGPLDTSQGSTFNMLYGERKMKGFLVTEHELEAVSNLNTQTQVFVGLGSFFASQMMSALSADFTAEKLKPAGAFMVAHGWWLFGLLAAVYFILAFNAHRGRSSMVKRIKDQTQHSPKT